MSEGL